MPNAEFGMLKENRCHPEDERGIWAGRDGRSAEGSRAHRLGFGVIPKRTSGCAPYPASAFLAPHPPRSLAHARDDSRSFFYIPNSAFSILHSALDSRF